jgi:hypothetical protein
LDANLGSWLHLGDIFWDAMKRNPAQVSGPVRVESA